MGHKIASFRISSSGPFSIDGNRYIYGMLHYNSDYVRKLNMIRYSMRVLSQESNA